MKPVTKRELIQNIVHSWESQFGSDPEKPRLREILEKLRGLDLATVSEDEIEAIIGNRSWTRLQCVECKHDSEEAIQFGDESEYDGQPFYVCPTCLRYANEEGAAAFGSADHDLLSVA